MSKAKIAAERKQLCWKCANTNAHACSWFKDFTYPDGAILDEHMYIIGCPRFQSTRTAYRRKKLYGENTAKNGS